MFCRNCGTQLPDEAKFCNKCGTQVNNIPAPPVEAEPKQEPTTPIAVVTPQPVPVVEQTPPPKVEVVQTPPPEPVVEQTPPVQEIVEPIPVPEKPEPVTIIPKQISEPEPIPEPIPAPVPEPIPEQEPPISAPVIPESVPVAEPPKAETIQAPPAVEAPPVPDPEPSPVPEESSTEPAVTAAEATTPEPVQTEPNNRCPNCQSELTPGIKFCPECGSAVVRQAATEESVPQVSAVVQPVSGTEPSPAEEAVLAGQADSEAQEDAPAFCPNCSTKLEPGAESCPRCGKALVSLPVTIPKPRTFRAYFNSLSTKAKIGLGSVAIVSVLLILCLFGESYDPALVEANNMYGLSTTVTLDEAIALYNEFLAVTNDIEKGSDYNWHLWVCGGITDKNNLIVAEDTENGLTHYAYLNPFSSSMGESGIDWAISFVTDSETGYLVYVRMVYERDKLDNASEANLEGVNLKYWALVYALVNGDIDTANKIKDMESWEDGWFKTVNTSNNGSSYLYAGCETKESFEANH